ncbi:hypothetical protein CSB37_04160 [bacterium DOLZORAL124_38_8]|nr:MAG: hypothetical protein CSB37_04160 [bacterium DOLZORAL124_38_8]
MKKLKLLALPLIGIMMTGCINVDMKTKVNNDGSFHSKHIIDARAAIQMGNSLEKEKHINKENQLSCKTLKMDIPNKSKCTEVEPGLMEIEAKGNLKVEKKGENFQASFPKEFFFAGKEKEPNPMVNISQLIEFPGEIISTNLKHTSLRLDGNRMILGDVNNIPETIQVVYKATPFDASKHTYKTTKTKSSKNSEKIDIESSANVQFNFNTKINTIDKSYQRTKSYEPERIIFMIEKNNKPKKTQRQSIYKNFFQNAAFKK